MKLKDAPIQRKLMKVILLTSGAVLILTCAAFFAYEFFTFRQATKSQLFTLGEIIAANSTAALAFDSREDANEILEALKAEKHVVAACLYDNDGQIFSKYPVDLPSNQFPIVPADDGFAFKESHLEGFQPVVQGNKRLGTLYLKSDLKAIYKRFQLYGLIAFLVVACSSLFAYFLSKRLQKTISTPILALAKTARAISDHHDYSVRATKLGSDELGLLTEAFNHMLTQIETQNLEITSFNQKLEQKVSERTRELEAAKEELEVVNDKLLKSNRDLEQFAYVASHDLQEPLRKIQVFTGMAERSLQNEEAVRIYFEKINSSAKRMATLIKDVLNYSRLPKTGDHFTETDLNTIIENIKTDFEVLISEKNAVIKCGPLPTIRGIPLQLNQLFLNLISNSLKFTEQQPVVEISAKIISGREASRHVDLNAATNYVELIFRDNGIGFEQEYANQIFTIFQRLHDRKDYAGTGIGLALCKKIVENHQGFISATSEVGKGSQFCVYLPV